MNTCINRICLGLFLLTFVHVCVAQSDTLIEFYNKKGKLVKSNKGRKKVCFTDSAGNYCVSWFAVNGQPESKVSYKTAEQKVLQGDAINYRENYWEDEHAIGSENLHSEGGYFDNKKNGIWKYFDTTGILKEEVFYQDGVKNGTYKKWNALGVLVQKGFFNNNMRNGDWIIFRYGKKYSGKYINGVKTGEWMEYFPSGQLRRVSNYRDGALNGLWQTWYETGICADSAMYDMGKIREIMITYYESGKIQSKKGFVGGSMERFETWWNEDGIVLVDPYKYSTSPSFKGTPEELKKLITPIWIGPEGLVGTVYVRFSVDRDGSISNLIIRKSPYEELSEKAITIVEDMEQWIPGKSFGYPIYSEFTLPINFIEINRTNIE